MNHNSPHLDAPFEHEINRMKQLKENSADISTILQRKVREIEIAYKAENQVLREDLIKLESDISDMRNELDMALERLEELCQTVS